MLTHPDPATQDVPPLPLPELQASLAKFQRSAAAVLSDEQLEQFSTSVENFAGSAGPELQSTLEQYAQAQQDAGSNWMAETWAEGYLRERRPLGLSTNVGFQMNLPTATTGADRIVELIRRIAVVHLQQAAGETPPEIGFRGRSISMDQWVTFNGGLRVPQTGMDSWEPAVSDEHNRFFGLLFNGRMWQVPLTDASGEMFSAELMHQMISGVVNATEPAVSNFAAPSSIGSEHLAGPYAEMLEDEHNQQVHHVLRELLFAVTVTMTRGNDTHFLHRTTFRPGFAWVYKPITYQFSLVTDQAVLHCEHSMVDGATLAEALRRVQQTPDPQTSAINPPAPSELHWRLTDELEAELDHQVGLVTQQAESVGVQLVTVPRMPEEALPFKMSSDARAQLIATLAQLLTYDRVRPAYEAVDMRQFRAGRTDCLRSVTPEMVEFVTALAQGNATAPQFRDALEAHRRWVKDVKAGAGYERHLTMLETIGQDLEPISGDGDGNNESDGRVRDQADDGNHSDGYRGDDGGRHGHRERSTGSLTEFFRQPVVEAARRDFLSTSSLGSDSQIIRFVYVPTVPEGFGVNYTAYPDRGEYLVTHFGQHNDTAEQFTKNLVLAGKMMWAFIRSLPVV